jgi:hypothetical protein
MNYENFVKQLLIKLLLPFVISQAWAINPIAQWQKPFPSHQLVTRNIPIQDTSAQAPPGPLVAPQEPNYEHIVLFSLQATIAAFHFNPETFSQDQSRLSEYFDDNALNQITQSLLPGSGYGLLDQCFLTQTPCDAITYQPVSIEKQSPHFLQVRLPMVLSTEYKVDVVLSIAHPAQSGFRVTNFIIEKPAQNAPH